MVWRSCCGGDGVVWCGVMRCVGACVAWRGVARWCWCGVVWCGLVIILRVIVELCSAGSECGAVCCAVSQIEHLQTVPKVPLPCQPPPPDWASSGSYSHAPWCGHSEDHLAARLLFGVLPSADTNVVNGNADVCP